MKENGFKIKEKNEELEFIETEEIMQKDYYFENLYLFEIINDI